MSGSRRLCQISSKSVKNCDRESARTHTEMKTVIISAVHYVVGHWTPDICCYA